MKTFRKLLEELRAYSYIPGGTRGFYHKNCKRKAMSRTPIYTSKAEESLARQKSKKLYKAECLADKLLQGLLMARALCMLALLCSGLITWTEIPIVLPVIAIVVLSAALGLLSAWIRARKKEIKEKYLYL